MARGRFRPGSGEADEPPDANTSALLAHSASWSADAITSTPAKRRRKKLGTEALRWQQISQDGSWVEMAAYLSRSRGKRPPSNRNRLVEIHGIMGSIGEQVGLCRMFEQDAQRLVATRRSRIEEHQRLILRAVSESAGHFLLGAAHSLGNLVLRVALLNQDAAPVIKARHKKANGFVSGNDDRESWPTLYNAEKTLRLAAQASTNKHLLRLADAITNLQTDRRFASLDRRRGMDYHRRRPQSVPHASPTKGTVESDGSTVSISMVGVSLDPEADADRMHNLVINAMEPLLVTLLVLRAEIPKAIRAERIVYNQERRRRRAQGK